MRKNNIVIVTGVIGSELALSHKIGGEEFYSSCIMASRKSSVLDAIPIVVSGRTFETALIIPGIRVEIIGQFRSRNSEGKVNLYLFVEDIKFSEREEDENRTSLVGYIVRNPIYRKTPAGREITELLVAVNRNCGRSDYIPCICWGRNARWAGKMHIGDCVSLFGRIQSREYVKTLLDGRKIAKTAYEVSVSSMEVVDDEKSNE